MMLFIWMKGKKRANLGNSSEEKAEKGNLPK
jgi:hypothetical protein